jgi:hypothetical protein
MAGRDEFELRVVEAMETLPAMKLAGPGAPTRLRAAPTPAEALAAVRATKGAASVIKRVPGLEQTNLWEEIAHWNVCETKGAATEIMVWDCDFPGTSWRVRDALSNCFAFFAGAEQLGEVLPPQTFTGQVWCFLDAPRTGDYLFVAQMQTDGLDGSVATVDCFIDSWSFGTLTLHSGQSNNHPFVAHLAAGHHQFTIKQITGGLFFERLTAWQIPVIEQ